MDKRKYIISLGIGESKALKIVEAAKLSVKRAHNFMAACASCISSGKACTNHGCMRTLRGTQLPVCLCHMAHMTRVL